MKIISTKTLLMAMAISLALLTGCGSTVLSHGNQLNPVSLAKVTPGKTRLIELESLFGRPSVDGAFDSGKVYYVTQIMEEKPGGRKTVVNRTIVTFTINEAGIVDAMDIDDAATGRRIYHIDARTPTPGDNYGVLEQIFRNVRSGNLGGT
jgi:outer membrane protein assembly factor BamE (lipoprotein component of BamABCDE complex)